MISRDEVLINRDKHISDVTFLMDKLRFNPFADLTIYENNINHSLYCIGVTVMELYWSQTITEEVYKKRIHQLLLTKKTLLEL